MDAAPISPWADRARVASPDGRYVAEIEAVEVAMGAPMAGTLYLSTGYTLEHCNPSMVWSEDSQFLAIPVWDERRAQRLVVIDVANSSYRYHHSRSRVLELHRFAVGVIEGVDSPAHSPLAFKVNLVDLTQGC